MRTWTLCLVGLAVAACGAPRHAAVPDLLTADLPSEPSPQETTLFPDGAALGIRDRVRQLASTMAQQPAAGEVQGQVTALSRNELTLLPDDGVPVTLQLSESTTGDPGVRLGSEVRASYTTDENGRAAQSVEVSP